MRMHHTGVDYIVTFEKGDFLGLARHRFDEDRRVWVTREVHAANEFDVRVTFPEQAVWALACRAARNVKGHAVEGVRGASQRCRAKVERSTPRQTVIVEVE